MRRKTVLVLGDYRQTVTVVRSLGRAGFRVVLGCERPHSSTAMSRHVSTVRLFDASSPGRFCDNLKAWLQQERPDFVFPVGEAELRWLLNDGRHALASLSSWVMPDAATVLRCFDKRAMYHLATALGIPVCEWRSYNGVPGCLRDASTLGYPVVMKRKDSSATLRGSKAVICRSVGELEQFLANAHHDPDPGSLIVQKYATGDRHNCHFVSDRGRIVAFFEQKVLRTDGQDGTGSGLEGISVAPLPELRAYCQRLLEHLEYTGIGCIQFLVDDLTKSVAFLEVNARMDSTAALPYRLGIDFPLIALRIAAGQTVQVPRDYALGKRYYSLYEDINVWLGHRRCISPGRLFAWSMKMPWLALRSYDLMFDWRDPVPALHQVGKKAVESTIKLVRRPKEKTARKGSIESSARP